jgi:2-polyprenyl-6-methoxyphenol hydroxylase-like FAD-dependent oxidoreductase
MGIPRFFKLPQHKQFHYEPIYYDERKERMEERIRQIEAEYGIKTDDRPVRSLTKGSFSHFYVRRRKAQRYSTTRLVIIMIFLFIISYFLFFA